MKTNALIQIQDSSLASFYEMNPDFDILTFNFLDANDPYNIKGQLSSSNEKTLMSYQRVLRLYPDLDVANELLSDQLDSSIRITNLGQTNFVNNYGPRLGANGKDIARKVYAAATECKSRVMHLVASAKNVAASPGFSAMLFNPVSDDVSKTFQDLDSYQDFFGSLDYCDCDECKSIFGPAAYLVDLLRIIDQNITKPNPDIQAGLHLFDRRPDIEKIELTCENTNNLVPYLQIVNNLMSNTLENALQQSNSLIGDDVYLTLANSYFPFNLPFNLPLQQIETVLDNKNIELSDIAEVLSTIGSPMSADLARKILEFSLETLNNLLSPVPANLAAVLSANYGLTVTTGDLNGLNKVDVFLKQSSLSLTDLHQVLNENLSAKEIFDVTGNYTPSAFGPSLILDQQGSSVAGTYFTDGIIKGTMDGLVMRGQWQSATQAAPTTKGDIEFTFSADGKSFTGNWSKGLGMPWESTPWNGTLNGTSTQGIIPHSLFINATLSPLQYLQIEGTSEGAEIPLQSLGTLDHLNRFIRLSALMGWSFADTNWTLKTLLGTNDISTDTFTELAKIKQIMTNYGMDLNLLNSMWFDLKTIGMGPGLVSEAPFDQLFNSQVILQQTGKFYRPTIAASANSFVNPLYTNQAYLFVINQDAYNKSNPSDAQKLLVEQGLVIIRGIPASQDNILAIALAAFGDVATIELTVSNLSVLYRHTMLAAQMNTTIDRYVILLKLLGYVTTTQGTYLINNVLNRDSVLNILNNAAAIQASGFTVYDIDYLINQVAGRVLNPYVNNGYRLASVPEFLKTLQTVLSGSICTPDGFASTNITGEESEQAFACLLSLGFIDVSGLIVKNSSSLTPANWASMYLGTSIQPNDFTSDTITADDSAKIFKGLVTQKIINNSGWILTDPSKTNWTTILIGNPPAPLSAAQQTAVIAEMLSLQTQPDANQQTFISSQLSTLQAHQADVFSNQIAAFFGVKESLTTPAIDAVRGSNLAYLLPFMIVTDPPSNDTQTFLLNVSKLLMLQRIPALTEAQFLSICQNPAAYSLSGTNTYALLPVLLVAGLKPMVQSLGDTDDKLVEYFANVWSSNPPSAGTLQNELCALTGWDKQQYISIAGSILNNAAGCKTLSDVGAVNAVFVLANTLGIDTYFLQELNTATSLAATAVNWPVCNATASKLLLTLQATTSSDAITDQYKTIRGQIEAKKRDAMLFFAISVLGKVWTDIKNPDNLYEFLLIDPETSGCSDVSLIEEAMNAAQLYLQRCRLNLEKDIQISTDDIPNVWWEWMMSYRVWQANRKVFVYPENYIDPRLRKSQTSLFSNLENTLMQGEITSDLVETAYVKYMDDFSLFAKLRYVDAYQTIVHDKDRGEIDTLYLFARTQEQPYHFYYIARETVGNCTGGDQYQWTQWKNINIKIDAQHVTPVYAFNKLFVFWVELSNSKESGGLTGTTGNNTAITTHSNIITKASIKYSYYNFNEQWIQPQTMVGDKVVNVFSLEPGLYGSFNQQFTDLEASCWTRVSVINTQAENYVGATKAPDEKLIVYFGPLANYDNLDVIPAIPDLVNDSTSMYAFKDMLKQAYFNLEQMAYFNRQGYTPLCSHYVMDEILSNQIILSQNEYLVLASNTLSTFMPPTFTPDLNNNLLAIRTDYSTIVTNNCNGIESRYTSLETGSQTVTDSSFIIYPYIDSVQSAAITADIHKNMPWIIDASNKLLPAALTVTLSDISSRLGLTWNVAELIQTRFYELYYGSCILFSNLAYNSEIVAVKNQPNTFILDNNDEAFLITAVNNVIETTVPVLNPDSFVSATIDKTTSEAYFKILSTDPNSYINKDNTVNAGLLSTLTAYNLSLILFSTVAVATEVLVVLTTGSKPISQTVDTRGFDKIETNITIMAALSPDCFVSTTTTASMSSAYYNILSSSPNNYINKDGSVDPAKAMNADPYAISLLLGLQPNDPEVMIVIDMMRAAADLVTKHSFVTTAINPDTEQPYITTTMSEAYFTTLSTYPNNYIQPNGFVNMNMLNNTSSYTIAILLGFSTNPDNFIVAKVLNVLRSYNPVTLSYVYADPAIQSLSNTLSYELDTIYSLQFIVERISTGAINPITHAMAFGGIDTALSLEIQQPPVTITKPFSNLQPNSSSLVAPLQGAVLIPPAIITNQEVNFNGPYGMYYWELFFHTPFLIASMLNANQQFADAESWIQYIFNPTAQNKYLTKEVFIDQGPKDMSPGLLGDLYPILTTSPNMYIDSRGVVTPLARKSSAYNISILLSLSMGQATEILNLLNNYYVTVPQMRAWQFDPFRNYTLQTLLHNLTSCSQIAVYNDDPFDPDAIARLRIGAYEKTIMMKYIDNLIDWGDFEFTQYSWESITMARMYYTYAADLLGPQPVNLGSSETPLPVTFQDIAAKYQDGEIPQFLIDMEHLSGQGTIMPVTSNITKPYNDLGFYFCIPENDLLESYWDRVNDRLYKIRNCLNIDGVAQPLPLFQPPINPMDLVRAAAQGGNVLGVVNQQQQNISYYRFTYLIERAKTYTQMVSDLGNSMLSALEKSDSEALAVLNLNQAKTILNMTMVIKNKQLEGLQNQLAGTQETLQSAQNRNLFYTTLINLGYNASENSSLAYMQTSIEMQEVIAGIQGVSIVGYLAPCIFGFSDGGMKFGDAINMGAQMLGTTSQIMTQQSGSAATVAQFQRRAEDWKLQQQTAQFDINQLQDQILSLQANNAASQQEIEIQQKNIDQNNDLLIFYQSKFTSQELYQWMISRISSIYFQAYKLALDTALTAQMSYQYELDRNDSYITFGYWDSLHKGLLAADGLKLSLAQLENAYTDNNKRRMEIEKTISLKSLNPEVFYAFISGANKGELMFSLTEELYDRDFPSQYCRRIKSVSVSIPAVVGPYQNIHATLTQNTNLVVLKPNKDVVNYAIYQTAPQKSGKAPAQPTADAMRQNWASSQQIALSKGVDDTGLFALSYDDPRYLPFEATGAVSSWTLSMPPETNQIDFSGISDVILTVRYTAKDGGSSFGRDVTSLYTGTDQQYQNIRVNSFDLNQAFAGSWYKLFQTPPDANKKQTITFPVSDSVVLPNLKNVQLNQIVIELQTAGGSVVSNNTKGLLLTVGTVSVPVTIANNRGIVSASDLATITKWQGQDWSLVFVTDQITQLCNNNQLDPLKLLDAIVFIGYTSNM